jgi:1-acyl-sn-glycerol-3-phosphate acyltransferase
VKPASPKTLRGSVPEVNPSLLALFSTYSHHFVRRHFHSVRILQDSLPPADIPGPLVIYLNHASWWDPLICLLLARRFFRERTSYAPIDAEMLGRYGFFKHLGFYGIDARPGIGARSFVAISSALLAYDRNAIWLTPQGRFADVRERPLGARPGIGFLAASLPQVYFLPVALEYVFWTEPQPEALLCFGEAVSPQSLMARAPAAWADYLSKLLEQVQEKLADRSRQRQPKDWMTLEKGMEGINPAYDAWRWLRAKLHRRQFVRGHHSPS